MSKMSNLYLEQSEIAQNYIGDFIDGHYDSLDQAKIAFTKDKSFINMVGAESVFDDQVQHAQDIGVL